MSKGQEKHQNSPSETSGRAPLPAAIPSNGVSYRFYYERDTLILILSTICLETKNSWLGRLPAALDFIAMPWTARHALDYLPRPGLLATAWTARHVMDCLAPWTARYALDCLATSGLHSNVCDKKFEGKAMSQVLCFYVNLFNYYSSCSSKTLIFPRTPVPATTGGQQPRHESNNQMTMLSVCNP